jgi:hypothetical protein
MMAREPSGGGTLHYFLGEEILKPLSGLGQPWATEGGQRGATRVLGLGSPMGEAVSRQ